MLRVTGKPCVELCCPGLQRNPAPASKSLLLLIVPFYDLHYVGRQPLLLAHASGRNTCGSSFQVVSSNDVFGDAREQRGRPESSLAQMSNPAFRDNALKDELLTQNTEKIPLHTLSERVAYARVTHLLCSRGRRNVKANKQAFEEADNGVEQFLKAKKEGNILQGTNGIPASPSYLISFEGIRQMIGTRS